MTVRRRTLLGSGLLVAGLVGLAALVIAVFVFTGDSVPEPPTEALAPPPAPPPPPPVEGDAELAEVVDLSMTGSRVVHAGTAENEPVPVDQEAVEARVATLTAWLDEHLTSLQKHGDGLVAEVGLAGPAGAGDLAGSGEAVDEARYDFTVGVRGEPEWVRVDVEVTTRDGDTHAATFAFTGAAEPELQAVEARS